jgi:hypothetical protein
MKELSSMVILSEVHGRTSFFIEPGLGNIHQTISGHSSIQQVFSAFRSNVSVVSYRKNKRNTKKSDKRITINNYNSPGVA